MAARGVNYDLDTFDVDKLPTNTLKRNPKNVDLTKTELLKLLSYLEGELQGRDVAIAALKADKAKQLLYQAKYGRFGLGDPFHALQRDSDSLQDNSFDEAAVKAMYDNQLNQLENLIETQRKAQTRMREQLAAVEKRYHKVCAELEEDKRRHAQETEEGDNVTCMLEKERERLKQELEFEKSQTKKLEKELKKTNISSEEDKGTADKHKTVAIELIKERNKLIEKLFQLHQRNKQLEKILKDEQDKTKEMAEGLSVHGQQSIQNEARLEKALSDFDTEREQLKLKLSREETKNKELAIEVERLRYQIELLQRQEGLNSLEVRTSAGSKVPGSSTNTGSSPLTVNNTDITRTAPASPNALASTTAGVSAAEKTPVASPRASHQQVGNQSQKALGVHKSKTSSPTSASATATPPSEGHAIPVVHVRNPPDGREVASPVGGGGRSPHPDTGAKRTLMKSFNNVNSCSGVGTGEHNVKVESVGQNDRTLYKPVPAEKPAELQGTKVVSQSSPNSPVINMSSGTGTTVFTTPSGTRISLNVGPPSVSSSLINSHSPTPSPRKSYAGGGKGNPPPVPPNKPQVFLPTQQPNAQAQQSPSTAAKTLSSSPRLSDGDINSNLSPGVQQGTRPLSPAVGSAVGSVPVPVQHHHTATAGKAAAPRFANLTFSGGSSPGVLVPSGAGKAKAGGGREVRKPPPQVSLFK